MTTTIEKFFEAPYFFNRWIVLSVTLTFLNDFYLKSLAAGTMWSLFTGKISDVFGLFFFPVFLTYVFHRIFNFKFSQRLIVFSCGVTATFFLTFKFVGIFRDSLTQIFDKYFFAIAIVNDATDLIALLSVVVAYYFLLSWRKRHDASPGAIVSTGINA